MVMIKKGRTVEVRTSNSLILDTNCKESAITCSPNTRWPERIMKGEVLQKGEYRDEQSRDMKKKAKMGKPK
jgi:hypothetical protein